MKLFCAMVGRAGGAFEVNIDVSASVFALKNAIKEVKQNDLKYIDADNLHLFLAKKNDTWLKDDDTLDEVLLRGDVTSYKKMRGSWKLNDSELFGDGVFPTEKVVHVLVVISLQVPQQGPALAPTVHIPTLTPLADWDQYLAECSLDQWKPGKVHKIPFIWRFMESWGGCTKTNQMFWRLEDKQVASILLGRWFEEPSKIYANRKSILVGSPGIGKSTLLCVMAFFLVLKKKKNVLMYRRVNAMDQFDCLLYLGYHDGQFVYFGLQIPESAPALGIYKELCDRQGISNVWLLLDGFHYESIPNRLRSFRMLATSQQSDLKESELEHAYRCLLPCWKKQDLFELGKKLYDFDEEDMADRYYFSGGSVRVFTKETFIDIREAMSIACTHVESALALSSGVADIQAGQGHVDRVRHTFVVNTGDPDDYVDSTRWEQIIDSEFAFLRLSVKLRSNELLRFFHWARRAGHGALAGTIFEICLHRLAADNDLILHVSEYDLPTYRRPDEERYFSMELLEMKKGRAFCSDTASQATSNKTEGLLRNKSSTSSIPKDLRKELEEWRDNDELSYWYPLCDNFPNFDSIVKLEARSSNGKKGGVAYIQLMIADTHSVDGKHLENLKEIFDVDDADPPIYIVLCPDLESSKNVEVVLKPKFLKRSKEEEEFVDACYSVATFADQYNSDRTGSIELLLDSELEENHAVKAPVVVRKRGRPKSKPSPEDSGVLIPSAVASALLNGDTSLLLNSEDRSSKRRCSVCGEAGHSKRTCSSCPVGEERHS